jgi:hypothetical protein
VSKKLFITSDIHGFYTELMAALSDAGFDAENEDHYFVSCGDLFDRGMENARVYGFVKGLQRKILIKGNHEDMLCEVLDCGISTSRERDNGADITITQLIGEDAIDENGRIDTALYAGKIREINDFVASMSDYYEADGYVFTHGWLPVVFEGRYPSVNEAWRDASASEWKFAHECEWQQFYSVRAVLPGKTIVCGHRPSYLGYMFDGLRERDCILPFYGEGMIAIDANTAKSGKVNVLVIEVPEN